MQAHKSFINNAIMNRLMIL